MTSSALPADRVRVAVFAKAPVAGMVKTRLAPALDAQAAADLHAELVRRALSNAVLSNVGPVQLWCAPDETHPFFSRCAAETGAGLCRQEGGDLGARMAHAFDAAFRSHDKLLLIGSDCPAMTPAHIAAAAAALESHDAVFIPAEDGGYVLVGLSRPIPGVFEGVEWGTRGVMAATRERLRESGARWHEMTPLWDIDRPEDHARLQREGLLREALS